MASELGYPEYKTSRDSWLGKIPAHWREVPIKRIARVDNSGAYGDEPGTQEVNLPVATTAQISAEGKFDVGRMPVRSFSGAEVRRYACNPDDILIVKSSGSAANIISGKAGLVDTDTPSFIYSNFLMRLVPDRAAVHPRFLYALIVSSVTRERVQRMVSTTTYPNLQVGEYVNSVAPCPSLEEQTQIAKFLDYETTKIDALIEKQQQLIALLKEKRQAVISHAVTKGLNPDASMRDSGIEWQGEVPAHWDTLRVGVLFSESSARATTPKELRLPILSVSIHHGISDRELDEEELDRKVARSEDRSLYKTVHKNDLAYNMMRAWQGGFGAATIPGLISPAYVVCKPKRDFCSRYFELVLRTASAIVELKRFPGALLTFGSDCIGTISRTSACLFHRGTR